MNNRVANVLESPACGLVRGDRVMVILPRIPQWWAINIACIRTGMQIIIFYVILLCETAKLRWKYSYEKNK